MVYTIPSLTHWHITTFNKKVEPKSLTESDLTFQSSLTPCIALPESTQCPDHNINTLPEQSTLLYNPFFTH